MANNYLQYSFELTDLTPEEAGALEEAFQLATADEDEPDCGGISGTNWNIRTNKKGVTSCWIHAEEYGDPGTVAELLQEWLEKLDSDRIIAFTWAETCEMPRSGEFSGGGVVIIKDEVIWFQPNQQIAEWVESYKWATQLLKGGES